MQERLQAIFPVSASTLSDRARVESIQKIVDSMTFVYVAPLNKGLSGAAMPAVASPMQLGKLGLKPAITKDYYSAVVGGSVTSEFSLMVTKSETVDLSGQINADKARLDAGLAAREGVFVPRFASAEDVISLFSVWDPPALEALRKHLQFSLPGQTRSVDEMMVFLDPAHSDRFFSEENVFQRLAPLRMRLNEFVLSEPDGQKFLRQALRLYLLHLADFAPQSFDKLMDGFETHPEILNALFSKDLMSSMGLSGLSLRIPLSVGPKNYTVLRHDRDSNAYVRQLTEPPSPARAP
jgi:hypothetical protein